VEQGLALMHNFRLSGEYSYIRILMGFADTVLDAGKAFLEFLAVEQHYQPRR
jgi:hypothetical protein